jgi:predicted acyltransferase
MTERIRSVDALRGFDMFWIVGAGALCRAIEKMTETPVTTFLATQLQHVKWEGFRFYDLIFPLFLFIIGISIVFSLGKADRNQALKRIIRRGVLLFLLGVFYSGGLSEKWPNVALGGVLQRIAACYLFAATIFLFFRPRVIAAIGVALLVGYWALLTFVPFPDIHLEPETVKKLATQVGSDSPSAIAAAVPQRVSGLYEEGRNLTNYLDFRFLPGKKAQHYYINEGLLSTLPSIAISLAGIFAGLLFRSSSVDDRRKVAWLFGGGLAAVALGFLWSCQFPMIKRIWSSSFCLTAAGYSAMLMAVFYLIVDVWKWQRWCEPFVWIGMNPITIYLAANIVPFGKVAERFAGGDVKAFLDANVAKGFGYLVIALVSLGLVVWLAHFLYRRQIFLRV